MSAMASQINGISVVCWTVCSGSDQRKHQSSVSLAFVMGIPRWPVDSPPKGPVTQKMFPYDDVIMMPLLTCNHWKHKSHYNANFFFVTGSSTGCRYNNLQCQQWWQSWHHGNSQFSAKELRLFHTIPLIRLISIQISHWSLNRNITFRMNDYGINQTIPQHCCHVGGVLYIAQASIP